MQRYVFLLIICKKKKKILIFIAKEIYFSDDIQGSLSKIKNIGGVDNLRKMIFNHFFDRSNMLRCNKVLEDVRRIIADITYDESFIFAEDNALMKDECMEACQNLPEKIRNVMCRIISSNMPSLSDVKRDKEILAGLKNELESIKAELKVVNESYMAYQKIVAAREFFNEKEFKELLSLFAGQSIVFDCIERYKHWAAVYNMSPANSLRQQVAKNAKEKYMLMIKSNS